jgi:hypothetical protein
MNDQNQPADAWALSVLGSAIGAYVDREINKPTVIANSNNYGMDANGNLYTLGQPAGQVAANVSTTKAANMNVLLLILGIAFLASRS